MSVEPAIGGLSETIVPNLVLHFCRRFAKMWFKGISFSSKNCPLVYLVDAAGVRSTVDRFPEIMEENASEVFYGYAVSRPTRPCQ